MTANSTAIDHADRRLVVALPRPYDEAREHYEALVPHVDSARFSQMGSWQATLELAGINAPHGFMIYYRSDVTAVMAGSPSFWKATQYLTGNHTIAERIFRHDPPVMLHAPLRTLLYADPTATPSSHPIRRSSLGRAVQHLRRPPQRRKQVTAETEVNRWLT
jgi:hypothetical protein